MLIFNQFYGIIILIGIHTEEIWDRWNKAVDGEYIERIEPKQI